MESVPFPKLGASFRTSHAISLALLKRGAKVREAVELGELILATRYVNRVAPEMTNREIADLMDLSHATLYRRRDRVRELTGVLPEDFPVDVSAMAPPAKVALGLVALT